MQPRLPEGIMSSEHERFFSEGKNEKELRQYSTDTLLHERKMLENSIVEMDEEYKDPERMKRFDPEKHQQWRAANRKARNHKQKAISHINAALDHKADVGNAVFKLVKRIFEVFPEAKENKEILSLTENVYKLTRA
jgi:hypothetical protein